MNNGEFYLADTIDIIEEVLSSGGEFHIYPKGTSMLPLIRQGKDSVSLSRREGNRLKKHDIAFYRRDNGAFVLHRVMKIKKDGSYVMCGDNQTKLEYGVKKEQIIGYANQVYRDEVPFPISSFKYRAYVFFWCIMPYRRAERFIVRIFNAVKRRLIKK